MFHFAGGISFGVDVGNLLQLEGAFQRDRIMNATSEKQKVMGPLVMFRKLLAQFIAGQKLFEFAGNMSDFLNRRSCLFGGHRAAHLREIQGEQTKRGELSATSLVQS